MTAHGSNRAPCEHMMLIVANYHYVRPRFEHRFPGIHGVTMSAFEAQLQLLGRVGQFVSASQTRDAVRGAAPLPARALLVTFDDGLREQVEYALPVLDRLGIPALFFVNTRPIAERVVSPVHKIHLLRAHTPPAVFSALVHAEARHRGLEISRAVDPADAAANYPWDSPETAQLKFFLNHRLTADARDALIDPCFRQHFGDDEAAISRELYMDIEQVRALSARGYLGTHGDRHLVLGRISRSVARHDIQVSLDRLVSWTAVRPFALSYPCGSSEKSTLNAGASAADLGLELAFTSERAANFDLRQSLYLARFNCNDVPGGARPLFTVDSLFQDAPPARWHRARPKVVSSEPRRVPARNRAGPLSQAPRVMPTTGSGQ
jgi:peptidoglycan/xylan/chitin deacetylase (PgdA/CDA1 family)